MVNTYLATLEDEYARYADLIENSPVVLLLSDPYQASIGQIDGAFNDVLNKSIAELGAARVKKGVRGLDPDDLPTPDELRAKRDKAIKYIGEQAQKAKEAAEKAVEAAKEAAKDAAKAAKEAEETPEPTPLEQSGLSERDFTEWKAKVPPADYVRWRKSGQTVDQWLDDEIDEKIYNEHNDLGAVLENYFGNNIIKNIKIGSKTDPRSGDKK